MSARLFLSLALLAATTLAQSTAWQSLFDGKTLDGWKRTPFTKGGAPVVADGAIQLVPGEPMTGVTRTGDFPKINYELRFEGMRQKGNDFFASVTFPVENSFATLVTGGWGGDIVGVSSIEGWDASDNETRSYFTFENGRWYKFRVQVTAERIRAWIDDQPVVNVGIAGRVISLRPGEIERSAPLGFASYRTAGAVRSIEYKMLK
jgi:hypothetical protein